MTTERYVVCPQRNIAGAYRRFFAPRLPRSSTVLHHRWIGALISVPVLGILGWLLLT